MQNKLIKTTILSTILASSSLLASDISMSSAGVNLGKSYSDFSKKHTTNTITLNNKPDKSFSSIELYVTLNPMLNLCKEYNIRTTLSYTYSKNSELKHQHLLAGLNKYYTPQTTKLEFYTGLLLGYGQLDYKYDPLSNSTVKDINTNSPIAGLQAGVSYPVTKKLSLGLNTKYLLHNNETDLKISSATATIEHKSTAFIGIGIEWKFGVKQTPKDIKETKVQEVKPVQKQEPVKELKPEKVIKEEPNEIKEIAVAPLDSDSDGVIDADDKCQNTPDAIETDKYGCPKNLTLNIQFNYKSTDISDSSQQQISDFVKFLKDNIEYKVTIGGHSDNIGSDMYNLKLSTQRAESVAKAIISQGVDTSRVSYVGYGETRPVASNKTKEGRELNRRIEARLYY
jgi:outer membrane protein OmpA-like peptidoglycan-associated protein